MRRALLLSLVVVAALAQSSRDAYRAAYRAWREADPNLERDAGAGIPSVAARADHVAAEAAKFGAARSDFLKQPAADSQFAWLESAPAIPAADVSQSTTTYLASESALVRRTSDSFSKDPDAGIQMLRDMLERESLALKSLDSAINDRQKAVDQVKLAVAAVEQARVKAAAAEQQITAAEKGAVAESDREALAWADYYRTLADSSRVSSLVETTTAPPSETSAPAPEVRTVAVQPPVQQPAQTPIPAAVPSAAIVRFLGAWTFPKGGLYHGSQPEILDLVVREENGHADGTLTARFRVSPNGGVDPTLRFTFSGDFKPTRTQLLNLETAEGAHGTLELIPGPATNLLEINFQTEFKPGKIQQGNVVLVKK